MTHLTEDFIEEMKTKLLEEKQRLTEELSNLPGHLEIGSRSDENAKEAEDDEVNNSLKIRIEADLEKIETALAKIDAGTYGIDDSGRQISEDRLRALPWADKAI